VQIFHCIVLYCIVLYCKELKIKCTLPVGAYLHCSAVKAQTPLFGFVVDLLHNTSTTNQNQCSNLILFTSTKTLIAEPQKYKTERMEENESIYLDFRTSPARRTDEISH